MKIILYVDFSSKEFNKDFVISNALLKEHTVLLVTSKEQLNNAYKSYDILLYGNSIEKIDDINNIKNYSISGLSIEEIEELIKK